jgi:hypothetical protein
MTTSDDSGYPGTPHLHADELTRISLELTGKYRGTFTEEEVDAVVRDAYQGLAAGAKVTSYLPVLASHAARERLEILAHERHTDGNDWTGQEN